MLSTLRNAVRKSTQPLIRQHPPRAFAPLLAAQSRFFAAPAEATKASASAVPKQMSEAEKEARRVELKSGKPGSDIFDPFI
jgi:hypothetical protein